MTYYKIISDDDKLICAYAVSSPVYIHVQKENGILVRCDYNDASGIVSPDGEHVYTLFGKTIGAGFDSPEKAAIISYVEYEAYIMEQDQIDTEDESPQIHEDVPEETILTRAELTRRITELEEQNEFLQNCILEMSEIIYS